MKEEKVVKCRFCHFFNLWISSPNACRTHLVGDVQPHLCQLRQHGRAEGGVTGWAAPLHRERTAQEQAGPSMLQPLPMCSLAMCLPEGMAGINSAMHRAADGIDHIVLLERGLATTEDLIKRVPIAWRQRQCSVARGPAAWACRRVVQRGSESDTQLHEDRSRECAARGAQHDGSCQLHDDRPQRARGSASVTRYWGRDPVEKQGNKRLKTRAKATFYHLLFPQVQE